jgi:hypothetical protein
MPDCLSEQPRCSDQEHDGEHEQAWNEQKFSARQIVYHVNNLKEVETFPSVCPLTNITLRYTIWYIVKLYDVLEENNVR